MIKGIVQINSLNQKVVVPESTCDMLFGIVRPNQSFIDQNGYIYDDCNQLVEDQIVIARLNYYNKTCIIVSS